MSTITHLFRFHRWANLRLLDACATLTPEQLAATSPGSFGSIQATLVHYILNETRFIDVLRESDASFGAFPDPLPSVAELRAVAISNADALDGFARSVDDDTRVRGELRGRPFDIPAYIPLFQAVNHGIEHRTNITTTLASSGVEPPTLDLWSFQRAGEAP
jgi:uncharacterized damage-inducible protein DinB